MIKRILSIVLLPMVMGTASAGSMCELRSIVFKQGNFDAVTFYADSYISGPLLAAHIVLSNQNQITSTTYYPSMCDTRGYQNANVYAMILLGSDHGIYQTKAPQDLSHSTGTNEITLTFSTSNSVLSDFRKISS